MLGLLALLFIVVPIVELYVIVQVAHSIGILPTIVLVFAVSAAGAWLCKREGVGLVRRIQRDLDAGEVPTTAVVDGFLVLFAGALLLTPGFVSDVFGVALLLPPVRFMVRTVLMRRFMRKVRQSAAGGFGPSGGRRTQVFIVDGRMPGGGGRGPRPGGGDPTIIDVEEASYERGDGHGRELPPR